MILLTPPDHPRIRGEHGAFQCLLRRGAGSSPHTRGAREPGLPGGRQCRIIPAYAGSTSLVMRSCCLGRDHPRIRGEHAPRGGDRQVSAGSSPHTRGARYPVPDPPQPARIIPAYAGSTSGMNSFSCRGWDHPRIRGEHVHIEAPQCPQMGSSPHTRGARATRYRLDPGLRIIPAYAGSTPGGSGRGEGAEDHPRIRGEHEGGFLRRSRWSGSSPHTRGAPPTAPGQQRDVRIIPAYAGSTTLAPKSRMSVRGSSPHTRGARPACQR